MTARQKARRLASEIKKGQEAVQAEWLMLGKRLHEFREMEGWLHDGSGAATFQEWCQDIGHVKYPTAQQYMAIHRTYVLDAGLDRKDLAKADAWKLTMGVGAIQTGADVARVVADAGVLSRPDFAKKHGRNRPSVRDVLREEIDRLSKRDGSWDHDKLERAALTRIEARPDVREQVLTYGLRTMAQEAARVTDDEDLRLFQPTYAPDGLRVNKRDADLTLYEALNVRQRYSAHALASTDRADFYDHLFTKGVDRAGDGDWRTVTIGELFTRDEIVQISRSLKREAA